MIIDHKVKISIIVPVYNREKLLEETILSVVKQDFREWEMILVDDGSTDSSFEIAQKFSKIDRRIKSIKREREPKGGSVCRNIGLENSIGEYIIFLDSDDLLAPFCMTQRLKYFEIFKNFDFLVFPMLLFKEEVNDLMVLQNIPTQTNYLDRFLLRENVWLMSSPIWKRESIGKLNGFSEKYLSYQDWEMNVRALIRGLKFYFIEEAIPDNYYRQHSETVSMNRFSDSHNESNIIMIFHIIDELISHQLFTEDRGNSLTGFFIKVINRYRNSHKPIGEIREIYQKFLHIARQKKLIDANEEKLISSFLKWHHTKLAYRFLWFRKFIDNYYLNRKLKRFFKPHESNQTRHIYAGSLDYYSVQGK